MNLQLQQTNNDNENQSTILLEMVPFKILSDSQIEVTFLTSSHKAIFLKYAKLDDKYILKPEDFPEFFQLMCMELNNIGLEQSIDDWLIQLHSWVNFVKKSHDDHIKTNKPFQFTPEDQHLVQHLKQTKLLPTLLDMEITCILDHLEIAGDAPKLWTTISMELDAISKRRTEAFWKKSFFKRMNRVTLKKQLLDQMQKNGIIVINESTLMNDVEIRLLNFANKTNSVHCKRPLEFHQNSCRVCLVFTEGMTYIFEETFDGLSIVEKFNQSACITMVTKNDGFPQYICKNCLVLLENAYQFKTLCEKTDSELKKLEKYSQKSVKEETIEFIQSQTILYTTDQIDEIIDDDDNNLNTDSNDVDTNEILELNDDLISNNDDSNTSIIDISKSATTSYILTNLESFSEQTELLASTESLNTIESLITTETASKNYQNKEKQKKIKIDEIGHQCETCGMIYKTKSTLNLHMKIHSNKKPHQCNDCGKNFKTNLSLKVHMRSHTGERPYVCETCGKAFKTCSAVINHRAIHSDVKQFKCPHCSYRGSTRANLRIHDRTHSGIQPYICKFCPLKFSTASNMHKHIRNIHQKLKTHKCDQCGRSFFTKESARKHTVTHSGLKPYLCKECPMAYGWYNGLQKHMKMQHPGIKMPTEKSFFDNFQNLMIPSE